MAGLDIDRTGPVTRASDGPEGAALEDGADVFERMESAVRTYSRRFPTVFKRASGPHMWDESGRRYIDFFSGAGALNYGHNHPVIKDRLVQYLMADGIVHSLDLYTTARRAFLEDLDRTILAPRRLDYRVQITGPTGTNAIEAALKIVRRATGRTSVGAFTNGFHGLSLGALATSATAYKRAGAGLPLTNVSRFPYEGFPDMSVDTISYVEALLDDPGSGVDVPAAVVVETVQGEGGVRAASSTWLIRLQELTRERGILLIVDDIQAGCGRTGSFFSFEEAGLEPDLVCLSKSLSGLGLPLAVVLVKPEHDVLKPGEHSGTFRGSNPAFVTAAAALSLWEDPVFERGLARRATHLDRRLRAIAGRFESLGCGVRGRGFLRGLSFADPQAARLVSAAAFRVGLLCETSGAAQDVLKVMPSIVMEETALDEGLDLLEEAMASALQRGDQYG